jgi:hypothetical protein
VVAFVLWEHEVAGSNPAAPTSPFSRTSVRTKLGRVNADRTAPQPKPAEFKTRVDGRGGLVRVRLVGEPHDGRELFIDEKDLPVEIYTSPWPDAFEWWSAGVKDVMEQSVLARDPSAPPVRYVLRIPDDTQEPLFISDTEAR